MGLRRLRDVPGPWEFKVFTLSVNLLQAQGAELGLGLVKGVYRVQEREIRGSKVEPPMFILDAATG